MKIAGITNFVPNTLYGAKKASNVKKNNYQNTFNTSPLNNLSQDKVSFGMKGSGKVNDIRDLLNYVGRDNATKILRTLQKCRYSKADILKSAKTKVFNKDGRCFLKNIKSIDTDDKFRGNCRELMLKAGKEIQEKCPDLNVYSMGVFNKEYEMMHCILAITQKDSYEDNAIKKNILNIDNDVLLVDPSFRSYKMGVYNPYASNICHIDDEIQVEQNQNGMVELEVNLPIILGNYADIATDLNLPQVSQKFGVNAKPPLLVIYNNGRQIKTAMASVIQDRDDEIIQFTAKNLKPYTNKFITNL